MTLTATLPDAAPAAAPDASVLWHDLLASASIEATAPQVEAVDDLAAFMPRGTPVYLPFLPDMAFADVLGACRRLVAAGLRPVPHLAARRLSGAGEIGDVLPRLVDAGVDSLLLIAGDQPRPLGPFSDTLQVLESGLLERYGIRRLGIAGHPEGHPAADDDELARVMHLKQRYARDTGTEMWIVSQFVFDADPLLAFDAWLARNGIDLPVRAGLPGPAKIRTLVAFALRCGVSASARALSQRSGAMKLLGGWTPDETIGDIARHKAAMPSSRIAGIHLFTFGGLETSLDWLRGMRESA